MVASMGLSGGTVCFRTDFSLFHLFNRNPLQSSPAFRVRAGMNLNTRLASASPIDTEVPLPRVWRGESLQKPVASPHKPLRFYATRVPDTHLLLRIVFSNN